MVKTDQKTPALVSTTALPCAIGLLPSSPIGPIWVAVSPQGLLAVDWNMSQADFTRQVQLHFHLNPGYDENATVHALQQIREYLTGHRKQFTLPLDLSRMSIFQKSVLLQTYAIPYGQISTYKEIAALVGKPRAARAVGRVEATNPIPLVIPCHRVLGSDGKLHGYGGPGGIRLKEWLLKLEGAEF